MIPHFQARHLQRHLTVTELSRFAGRHDKLTIEEKYKLIDEFVQRHTHGLIFGECYTVG